MKIAAIERFHKIRPFRPFFVRESSGETHRVVSPEMILLAPELDVAVIKTTEGDIVMLGADQISAAAYITPREQPK